MSQEPPRQMPQSAVQATGQVASDVVSGLKSQPMFLALVVLNILAIGAGTWYLNSQSERNSVIVKQLLEKCLDGHNNSQGRAP